MLLENVQNKMLVSNKNCINYYIDNFPLIWLLKKQLNMT